MRLVLALIVLLAAPASAAADVTLTDQSGGGVSYGANQKVTGRVTDAAGAPVARASVRLEAKAFPYAGRFKPVGTAKTAATGRFTFSHAFARNARLRAVVAASGETSPVVPTYVFPAATLTFRALSPHRLKLIQTLRTPRDVRLTAPTIFYLGSGRANTAPRAASAKPLRVAAGRFRATATVTLPDAWKGSFHAGACVRYSKGSGMGDPKTGCTKRLRF